MMKLTFFLMIVLFKCSRLSSAPTETSNNNKNSSDDFPVGDITTGHSMPNVAYVAEDDDLGKAGVVFQFRRSVKSDNTEIEARRRSAIDKGFMRFGRSKNVLRFGRSNPDTAQYDNEVNYLEHDDNELNEPYSMRMRKANGMLRFGRNGFMSNSFRSYPMERDEESDDADYNNDASEVFDLSERPVRRSSNNDNNNVNVKNNEDHSKKGIKILRLGRSSSESYSDENVGDLENAKEKRPSDKNLLRFGRADNKNMMRFGRGNMMRFGRGNMMRFGRSDGKNSFKIHSDDNEYVRSSRAGNVMRFGRSDRNPMRFGKRNSPQEVASSSRIYCENGKCLIQQKENRLIDENDKVTLSNQDFNKDQLNSLFGDDTKKQQGYAEYVLTK